VHAVDSTTLASGLADARLRLHQTLARHAALPAGLLTLASVAMLWPRADHLALLGWLALVAGALGLRAALAWAHRRAGTPAAQAWLWRYRALLAVHGLAWGFSAALLVHAGPSAPGADAGAMLLMASTAMCALSLGIGAFDPWQRHCSACPRACRCSAGQRWLAGLLQRSRSAWH
jgi:hypothetical protein